MGEFFKLINALMDAAEIHKQYGTRGCVLIVVAVVVIIAVIIGLVYLFGGS
jgi:hypothetical protein